MMRSALALFICAAALAGPAIQSAKLRVEFDGELRARLVALEGGRERPLGPFQAPAELRAGDRAFRSFRLASARNEAVQDAFGAGERLVLEGRDGAVAETLAVTFYKDFPEVAVLDAAFANAGDAPLAVTAWTSAAFALDGPKAARPAFWAYQAESTSRRRDWIRPLRTGFSEANFQGMNGSDYGGGTPLVDVWTAAGGIAVGHLDTVPRLCSLPVAVPAPGRATLAVAMEDRRTLAPGERLRALRTFAMAHGGDCFRSLAAYARLMGLLGLASRPSPESAFGPMWCAWGYGRKMVPAQIYGTLPEAAKLGFRWVTVDDGWQDNYGDWNLDPAKFPGGDADMKAIVDRIHKDGFLAQLWWCPMTAVGASKLLKDRPALALQNADGSRRKVEWWNSWYLCPADPEVQAFQESIVRKILVDWGFDGLKLDGQHMNAAPPCYNPAHRHARPEESVEAVPAFFKGLFEAAQKARPGALVEFCPCGTAASFFTMPWFTMSVASDPTSSFQVRSKGKVLKALMGDQVAYFGDHVELTESHVDFASTLAVGGVVGTQFSLPALAAKPSVFDLTPARERHFAKWVGLYREKMLSRGTYLGGLYDIGFDKPEGHAVRKGDALYYGFFAKAFRGEVELRGLEDREYAVRDYVQDRPLGTVHGPTARIRADFREHLLLQADPR